MSSQPRHRPALPAAGQWRVLRPLVVTVGVLGTFALLAGGGWYLLHAPLGSTPAAGCSTGGPPATVVTSVRVLNGSNRAGLAQTTADELALRKFRIVGIGNANRPYAGVAEIRHGAADLAAGRRLAAQLVGGVLVTDPKLRDEVDLILGRRFGGLRPAPPAAKPAATPRPAATRCRA